MAANAKGYRRSKPASRQTATRRNRAGIRQLDDDQALWQHFLSGSESESEAPRRSESGKVADRAAGPDALEKWIKTDRHGIPQLDQDVDLHRFFEGAAANAAEAAAIGKTLRQSLRHDAPGLIKQKGGGEWVPRRLTLKEQLRRYPPPQAQLDLHGAVALEARHRAEAFLQTAAADGLFSVRVIVGKGLHSEGGAVLPDVVEELLLDLKRQERILTYRWDKKVKRKSGALIVYLPPRF